MHNQKIKLHFDQVNSSTTPCDVVANDVELYPNSQVRMEADREVIENASGIGGGPELLRIRLNDENGLGAFFWVSATFNRQGRPVVQVSTEVGDEKVVKKSVVGVCKKL